MTDTPVTPNGDERDENVPPDGTATPERTNPEPEDGPFERSRDFLEERLTPLQPKSARTGAAPASLPPAAQKEPPRTGGGAPGTDGAPRTVDDDEEPSPLPDRRRTIREYRRRQQPPDAPRAAPDAPPANNWVPIGPSVVRQGQGGVMPAVSGRTPAIAPVAGGDRAYVGAANGGVWRTEDGGASWRSLMDAFDLDPTHTGSDSLAVGAIAVVPGADAGQDRLYVGSGEGQGGAYFGVGPLSSVDGGLNWVTEPVSPGSAPLAGSAFYALAVDPADPDRVIGATRQGLYRREPDGADGFHWDRKAPPGPGSVRATSVVVARSGGTTTFYAAFWFGPVYSSTDGDTWVRVGSDLPAPVGRISLAVRPDDPGVLYAFTEHGHVHRLDTADGTWRQVTGLPAPGDLVGGQGWYDLAVTVAPDDADRIYLGGSTVLSGGDWSGALYSCDVTVGASGPSASATYIGNSVHADIHTIVFTPGSTTQLWVGCDGGVYRTDDAAGTGNLFTSLNQGLQTLTQNFLGQHPAEDAVVFAGSQDNGGERFTGEEAWLYTSGGDSGYFVVNWNDPYRVADTYVRNLVRRSETGGRRYSYTNRPVPLSAGEGVRFYAPLAGTPANPAAPAEAEVLAFGSVRPWISTDFATSWRSIPGNSLASDALDAQIRCLTFASADKLYAGTMSGGVYRLDRSGTAWTRTRLDTMGGADALPLAGVVTSIAVDPADATGNSIYLTFGGSGDHRHVWHFDGARWQPRSGPAAGAGDALLDVQHNALVVDPTDPQHLYAGADIGIWRSTDGGASWQVFSGGLPDAAVLDLQLHAPRRLLRASTHGRGVFERTLDSAPKQGVELYVRDTQLDQGRFATVDFLPDPVHPGQTVAHWRGPDIKVDTPDVNGRYQFPPGAAIDFLDFVDTLSDDARAVATHATATITTRVYVQVHNRGVVPANDVRVMCLLANASAGLPPLPPGYATNVQNGTDITTADWQTLGVLTLHDVRVGFPRIAAFDLTSDRLPPPAALAGNHHFCVLALLHHADDPYTSAITHTDTNSLRERKAAHKNLLVVQFTGTLPDAPPVPVAFRVHGTDPERETIVDLEFDLSGYPGRTRLFLPSLRTTGALEEAGDGLSFGEDLEQFRAWAAEHADLVAENQQSEHPYRQDWAQQRIRDLQAALEHGVMFAADGGSRARLRGVVLPPGAGHTLFLLLDRPERAGVGRSYDLRIAQRDAGSGEVLGGLDVRAQIQPGS
ncbi:WD40/YVTN/BNR-like repeat-containing protein [Kocuria sp. NPDC057446]|uniref:WD40/YVTN/BNR-like repeat-containing protein n=1 Tax=Kocuria sp. NPDC057446 TaxID=3346137 RepID=UPI0036A18B25